ncbi:ROK family protein [Candidatus Bipolaricaulota bacterium]|nr:ROK family protein [Candidatus Bipolaricaulota bacterium]
MLHLAYATISTGFGVGAWDGGHLIHGKDGNAGELGHILARKNGRLCGCGHLGCVEAYCSGTGIVSNARARLRELADVERGASRFHRLAIADDAHVRSSDLTIEEVLGSITPARVFAAAAEGDPLAQSVISDAIFAAGVALAAIACAYDPEFITLGGGIALSHPELLGPIAEEMRAHINVRAPNVVITPLGAKVTECGAIAIAQRLLDG